MISYLLKIAVAAHSAARQEQVLVSVVGGVAVG